MDYPTYLIKAALLKTAVPMPRITPGGPRPLKPMPQPGLANRVTDMAGRAGMSGLNMAGRGIQGAAGLVREHPWASVLGPAAAGLGYAGYKTYKAVQNAFNPRAKELEDLTNQAMGGQQQ